MPNCGSSHRFPRSIRVTEAAVEPVRCLFAVHPTSVSSQRAGGRERLDDAASRRFGPRSVPRDAAGYRVAVGQAAIDPDAFNAFEARGWEDKAASYDHFVGDITPGSSSLS